MVSLFSGFSGPVEASRSSIRFYPLQYFLKENGIRAATWGRPYGKYEGGRVLRAADSRPYGIFRSLPKRRVREAAPYAPAPSTPARQSQARKWNRTSRHFCKPRAQRPDEGIGPYKIEAQVHRPQKTNRPDHRPLIRLA